MCVCVCVFTCTCFLDVVSLFLSMQGRQSVRARMFCMVGQIPSSVSKGVNLIYMYSDRLVLRESLD